MHIRAGILSLPFVALVAAGAVAPSVARASDVDVRIRVDGFTLGYRQTHYFPRHGYYHRYYHRHYRPHYYYRYGHGYRSGYYQRRPPYWHYKPGRYYSKRHPYYRSHTYGHDRGRHRGTRRQHRGPSGFRDVAVGRQHGRRRP